mmetsp:Transcript_16176/g.28338  ORF Transcript_16176/g.28338 Transcript_16176/m.28338 type:complete len:222 (-) Transcript_16176:739-1404(-)
METHLGRCFVDRYGGVDRTRRLQKQGSRRLRNKLAIAKEQDVVQFTLIGWIRGVLTGSHVAQFVCIGTRDVRNHVGLILLLLLLLFRTMQTQKKADDITNFKRLGDGMVLVPHEDISRGVIPNTVLHHPWHIVPLKFIRRQANTDTAPTGGTGRVGFPICCGGHFAAHRKLQVDWHLRFTRFNLSYGLYGAIQPTSVLLCHGIHMREHDIWVSSKFREAAS